MNAEVYLLLRLFMTQRTRIHPAWLCAWIRFWVQKMTWGNLYVGKQRNLNPPEQVKDKYRKSYNFLVFIFRAMICIRANYKKIFWT